MSKRSKELQRLSILMDEEEVTSIGKVLGKDGTSSC